MSRHPARPRRTVCRAGPRSLSARAAASVAGLPPRWGRGRRVGNRCRAHAAAGDRLANGTGTIQAVVADAGDPASAGHLLGRYEPDTVVLVAGARPHTRPLQDQTWETFSVNWETDVRIAFLWLREAW